MSAPTYDCYRKSGVEWLGEVPSHWNVKRLAHYFDERRTKVSDAVYPPLSVTKNGIVPQLDTAAKTDDGDNRKLVLSGDFVINSRSDRKGSSGLSRLDGSVSLINTVLTPQPGMVGNFAHHLLRSVPFQEEYYRYGKGIVADLWSTNFSEARNIVLAVPPPAEQAAIAAFLDRETGKIDALVEAQTRLIELLKEKRQAVISHAVTKGLDPAAPMKDSGVEWLGQLPAHWEVKPLRSFAELVTGLTPPSGDTSLYADDAEGHPWLRPEDLDEQGLPSTASRTLTDEGIALCRSIQARSSLVCCIGTIGKVGFVNEPVATNQQITAIQPSARHRFIYHALIAARAEMEASAVGNVLRILNSTRLGNIHLPLPPLDEADAISAHIDCQTAVTDELCDHAEAAITLLQERRAALISAAVTGKIDVRGLAPEQAEAA